jgi:SAM-dependent methyltransferase
MTVEQLQAFDGGTCGTSDLTDVLGLTPVLDACCGTRMMWFDKQDVRALYIDNREGIRIVDNGMTAATKGRKPREVRPDQIADFTKLPFPPETFWHVVFDPPHLKARENPDSVLRFNYGQLNDAWRDDLRLGFAECFRVLRPHGTLIFKWCESQIPLREVLALTPEKPLYGHRSGKKAQTHWVAFMKPNA